MGQQISTALLQSIHRIILVLVRMPQTAAVMARTVRHFQAVNPGTVSIWIAGPTSALMPVLAPNS